LDTVGPVLPPESLPLLRLDEEVFVSVVVFRLVLLAVDLNKRKSLKYSFSVKYSKQKKSNMLISN